MMNSSYANQPEVHWRTYSHIDQKNSTFDASSRDLRFSSSMHPLPSVQPKLQSSDSNEFPQIFGPYNQFIYSVPRGLNRLNTSHKSAFKPVGRYSQKTKPDVNIKECSAGSCFCHLPIKSRHNFNEVSKNRTFNTSVNGDSSNCTPLNLKINNSNVQTSSSQYQHHTIKGIPDSAIRPRMAMPLAKSNMHRFRLEQSELLIELDFI